VTSATLKSRPFWVDLCEVQVARNAWRRIGELFIEKALITGPELEQALAVQAATGDSFGEVLVSQDLVSSPEMAEVLMELLGRKVAKEEFGSDVWSEVRRRASRTSERQLTTSAESADELNHRVSQLTRHLADTQLALDQERVAYESARAEAAAGEKRIEELVGIVDRLQAERRERSQTNAKWRRTIKRTLFGTALRLAEE
jgi:hypothetical protein